VDRLAGWHATALSLRSSVVRVFLPAGCKAQPCAWWSTATEKTQRSLPLPPMAFAYDSAPATGLNSLPELLGADNTARVFSSRAEAEGSPKPKTAWFARLKPLKNNSGPGRRSRRLRAPGGAKSPGLSVKTPLPVIQALFETGHTTYPRTDTVRVSQEAIEWAREEISLRIGPSYLPAEPWQHKDRGDAVQGAHEAIRPTIPHEPGDSPHAGRRGSGCCLSSH